MTADSDTAALCGACALTLIDWNEEPDLDDLPSREAEPGEQCGACHRFMRVLYDVSEAPA